MPSIRKKLVARLLRLYPLYSGCGTLANHPLVLKAAGDSHEKAWSAVPGGEVYAALDDYDGRAAFYSGSLDRKINWVCRQIARPGDTVLDIGANIGMVMLELSSLVGKAGKVYAFEPNPELYTNLERTLKHNAISNIDLFSYALGETQGALELMVPRGHAGRASLVRNRGSDVCDTYSVPVKTLSGFISESGISDIRLIKIDVEGFEAEVFAGGIEVLRSMKPDVILFEVNQAEKLPPGEQAVFKILDSTGYKFLAIPRCLFKMRLNKFNPFDEGILGYNDFVAVSSDNYEEVARLLNVVDE